MSRRKDTPEERKRKHPYSSGTKEKVLHDLTRYVENPDTPMVPRGIANSLATTRNMDVTPAKMFEDGGHKVNAIRYLAARCAITSPPKTHAEVFDTLEAFLYWCGENRVPITLGGFAVWCGVTMVRINTIERDTRDPERAAAFSAAKECIRTFLEMSAFDNTLNPILWFHTNKTAFGAVENQQVTVRIEDNTAEISEDEYQERKRLLNADTIEMVQDEDGVYREP